jgi:hypothetical protein
LKDLIRLQNVSVSLHIKFAAVAHLVEGQFLHTIKKKNEVWVLQDRILRLIINQLWKDEI